jgi:hypothetical protein
MTGSVLTMKVQIQLTNNEFTTKDVKSGAKLDKNSNYVPRRLRRKYHDERHTTVLDMEATCFIHRRKLKLIDAKEDLYGILNHKDLMYLVCEKSVADEVIVAVPKFRGNFISGKKLEDWRKSMDIKYPDGWIPMPKSIFDDATVHILDILSQAKGAMSLDELKAYTEVDDFK